MLKVLFYHANDAPPSDPRVTNILYLSLASLYLKTYIEINHTNIANQIDWLMPIQPKLLDEDLIKTINDKRPDILCTSHYVWNHTFLKNQLSRVKNSLPENLKIITGGPSVDVNINENFFSENPYADYAIYGPGEKAFADIIQHLIKNKKLYALNVSNLAWYDKNKQQQVVSAYKYVPQSQISPFLHNKDLFATMVKNEQNAGIRVILPYELTRGCPYSCTFCDWNSGLSNKVSRRKKTYQQEIDLFQELKIKDFYLADANFGQYDEDIEIVEYMAYKNLNENTQFQIDGNLSKLRKDNNLEIYHIMAKGNLLYKEWGFTFSVQDINVRVLKNINRPDVGWKTHKKMLIELKENYPDIKSKVQFIVGLPGQNLKTIRNSLGRITKVRNARLSTFMSELLPASPASLDKEYQKKFKFVYSDSERVTAKGFFYRGKFPASCISFDQNEFVEMVILSTFYTGLALFREEIDYSDLNIVYLVDKFLQSDIFGMLKNNLYTNWVNNDKFYYTINFDGEAKIITACDMISAPGEWINSKEFSNFLFKNLKNDKMFIKSYMNRKALEVF